MQIIGCRKSCFIWNKSSKSFFVVWLKYTDRWAEIQGVWETLQRVKNHKILKVNNTITVGLTSYSKGSKELDDQGIADDLTTEI